MSDEARRGGCRTVASVNTEYRSTDGKYRESRRSPSRPLGEAVSVSIISRYILIEALHFIQVRAFELNIFWGKIIAAIKSRRVYLIPTIIIFFME